MMLTGKDETKVEFIESYIKHGAGDYTWNDNHGELIRCKDCKWCNDGFECAIQETAQEDNGWTPEWFCADGKRRTDDA